MDLQARKEQLINQIQLFGERELVNLEHILAKESNLSNELERSLREVEEGKIIPHVAVRKKYDKWL